MSDVLVSELLAQAGLEDTAHRRQVLAAVAESEGPVTAGEVGARVGAGENLNRVTVYRILELLVERGLVLRHSGPDRTFRYCRPEFAARTTVHCHAYCVVCGVCRCVDPPPEWANPEDRLEAEGFEINRVDIVMEGLCPDCRGRE